MLGGGGGGGGGGEREGDQNLLLPVPLEGDIYALRESIRATVGKRLEKVLNSPSLIPKQLAVSCMNYLALAKCFISKNFRFKFSNVHIWPT